MMRSCLEYAGYALIIFSDSDAQLVFVRRHGGPDDLKSQKKQFNAEIMRQTSKEIDEELGNELTEVYARTIDYGGHPNPNGMFNSMTVVSQDGMPIEIITVAITNDPKISAFAVNNVIQVGLLSLRMFGIIFPQKFDSLGINTTIGAMLRSSF